MIEIVCDNCERAFGVDDEMAGGKVPCPMCGDVNRVVADPEVVAPVAMAAADALPPVGGAEEEIRIVRPAMFRAHPFRYLLVVLLIVGGAGLSIFSFTEGAKPWLVWPGAIVALAGVVWWIAWWVATTLWIKVTITNKRTIRHEGLVRRHSTEVLHDHVRSVDIQQGFIQRLLNVGYIGVDSAGQDGIEIEIRDIPGPYEIKEIVDRYRKM